MGAEPYRCYVHLPCVSLEKPMDMARGTLRHVDFAEFAVLDGEWALESDYELSPRTFWVTDLPWIEPVGPSGGPAATVDGLDPVRLKARLVHYALLSVTRALLPIPDMSVTYAKRIGDDDTIVRIIGSSGRTWLTSRVDSTHVNSSELERAALIVATWERSGLSATSQTLAPLRAISGASSGGLSQEAMMGLLVIALEGVVDSNLTEGGAVRRFADGLREYALNHEIPDFESFTASLYATRSALVHGRALPQDGAPGLRWTVDMLARIAEARTLPAELRASAAGGSP